MKFIHYLKSIADVDIYPMISLLVFVLFFVAVLLYVIYMDRAHVERVSRIPLDESTPDHMGSAYEDQA